jgi:hypothetical protein
VQRGIQAARRGESFGGGARVGLKYLTSVKFLNTYPPVNTGGVSGAPVGRSMHARGILKHLNSLVRTFYYQ